MAGKVRDGWDKIITIKLAHTAATTKDIMYLLASQHPCLAVNSALINVENEFVTDGKIEYAKLTTDAVTVLQTLYWDDTNKWLTTTAGAHKKAGFATKTATGGGSGVATVELLLVSSLNSA